jgi:hypothetical protein
MLTPIANTETWSDPWQILLGNWSSSWLSRITHHARIIDIGLRTKVTTTDYLVLRQTNVNPAEHSMGNNQMYCTLERRRWHTLLLTFVVTTWLHNQCCSFNTENNHCFSKHYSCALQWTGGYLHTDFPSPNDTWPNRYNWKKMFSAKTNALHHVFGREMGSFGNSKVKKK